MNVSVDYLQLLRREASWRMIKQSGKTLTKKAITDIDQAYLQELGLTKVSHSFFHNDERSEFATIGGFFPGKFSRVVMISFCGFILFQSMIYETGPCPRPEILTEGQIKSTLEERNLSSNGTRSELNARLTQENYGIWGLESCKVLSFWRFHLWVLLCYL